MCATLREPSRGRSEGDVTSLRPIGYNETIMASSFNLNAYGAMFRVKAAYSFEVGGLLVRMYAFMRTIGTVSMLTLSGYSYFMAGLVASVVAFALFLISPRVSKKIDERGQGAIVVPATCIALSGCAILLVTVLLKLPIALCFVGAVLMGFLPTPQALTRARWVYLVKSGRLGDGAPELKTVFSYEGVMDDIVFMVSPALSIALASGIHPIAGMGCGFICCVVGTLLLASSKDTEPVPGWEKKLANREGAASADCSEGAASAESGAAAEGSRNGSAPAAGSGIACDVSADAVDDARASKKKRSRSLFLTNPVVRTLFFLSLLMGCFFGIFDTATVSFAQIELNDPVFASLILAIESLVSTIVGFVFGMILITARQSKKMLAFSIVIGLGYGSMIFVSSSVSLLVVIFVAAGTYAPFVITLNETAERAVPEANITEALTWVTSGSICGLAFGPTLAGVIIDTWGSFACFGTGAFVALAIPVLAILTYPMMKKQVG